MLNRHSVQKSLVVVVVAIAAIGPALLTPAVSVAQGFSDSDTREIASYMLTESGLAKYTQAVKNLGPMANRMSSTCDSDEDEGEQSLDQFADRIEATPGAKAAIQSAGMTAREYVVFTLSLFQTGLAAWAVSQPGGKLPPGTAMANVNFYRAHEAALQALGKRIQAADCDGDDGAEDDKEDER